MLKKNGMLKDIAVLKVNVNIKFISMQRFLVDVLFDVKVFPFIIIMKNAMLICRYRCDAKKVIIIILLLRKGFLLMCYSMSWFFVYQERAPQEDNYYHEVYYYAKVSYWYVIQCQIFIIIDGRDAQEDNYYYFLIMKS